VARPDGRAVFIVIYSSIMNQHEWNSEAYHRLSNPQFGWGVKVVERVAALPLRGDEHVMDAGCGTGRVTAELLKLLPRGRVVGVDLSANMLRQARESLSRFGDQVTFVNADLQQLPFREEFDGVFSTAVFHWAKDHVRLFANIFGALRSGGWLIAQCGGFGNLDRVRKRVRALQATREYARFFENWAEPWEYADDQTTAERLRSAGFVEVKTWLEDATFSMENGTGYREFLKTVIVRANLERITDVKQQDAFLDELTEQAAREDRFRLDYWRMNIAARKSME
jgi:trans-aconitate 2-methyltransferase